MTSSYSTDLKLELMVTGENAGTWGDKTNTNLNLVQQAVAGFESVTIADASTTALVMSNAALSNARNMVIKFATITLSGATTVTIPNGIEKFYIFDLTGITNPTNLTIKTASGTGFTAGESKIVAAYADGTNLNEIALDTLGGTIASAQIDDNAIVSAKISANQVTTAKIADNAVTSAKISADQITAAKIAQSTITQSELAANSVGSNQLVATAVQAGSYTLSSITVDADGRITSAADGSVSGGATGYDIGLRQTGPATGTYAAQADSSRLRIYMSGGGGGSGGRSPSIPQEEPQRTSGTGGSGAVAYHSIPVSAPYSVPYSVGAAGAAGPSTGTGGTGGATSFADPAGTLTVNGGNGGNRATGNANGTSGSSGSASPAGDITGWATGQTFGNMFAANTGQGGPGPTRRSAGVGTAGEEGLLYILENGKTY